MFSVFFLFSLFFKKLKTVLKNGKGTGPRSLSILLANIYGRQSLGCSRERT